jgi:PTS system mannose-specific IIC component
MASDVFASPVALLCLLLLGGWTAIDGTGVGQFMISRPLVAASLAGWLVGDAAAGARVGLVLEAFHLTVLPVGAARYPEGGPAAVTAGAVVAASAQLPSSFLVGVAFALLWEWFSGLTIRYLRQANVRIAALPEGAGAGAVELRHAAAIGLDFVRGMLLVGGGVIALAALLTLSQPLWSIGQRIPELAVAAGLVAMLASTARLFGGRLRLFVAGAVGGLLLLALGA